MPAKAQALAVDGAARCASSCERGEGVQGMMWARLKT